MILTLIASLLPLKVNNLFPQVTAGMKADELAESEASKSNAKAGMGKGGKEGKSARNKMDTVDAEDSF